MISEEQQEQASLYALDLLRAEEAGVFERELATNAELQTLVTELRDTAGSLARLVPQQAAPAAVKSRVMQQIAAEAAPASAKVVSFPTWVPWAIAAGLAFFCGMLALDRAKLQDRIAAAESQPILVALAAAEGAGAPAKAEALVSWQPGKQTGVIKIRNLPAAAAGKDYQLWTVDGAYQDPIDAGILRIDANGVAQIEFKPNKDAREVKAFAISLERKGGVPKREGPILLIGTV